MGTRGPVPERSDQRRRRNKVEGGITKVEVDEPPAVIPAVDPAWHVIAREWYESLKQSGQRQFFEPSDWSRARFVAQQMSLYLDTGRPSGHMLAAISSSMSELLDTEATRRRVRMEIERQKPDPVAEQAKVTAMSRYRRDRPAG